MERKLWLCIIAAFWSTIVGAQEISELSGTWDLLVEGGQTSTVEMPGGVVLDKNKKCQISCMTEVPADWAKDDIYLYLEQPLTDASVYVNKRKVPGKNWTALHDRCKITELIDAGEDNRLTIMFDKGLDIKGNPDKQLYGALGRIELERKPKQYGFLHVSLASAGEPQYVTFQSRLYNNLKTSDVNRFGVRVTDYGVMLRLFSYNNQEIPDKNDLVAQSGFYACNLGSYIAVTMKLHETMKSWTLSHPNRYLLVGMAGNDYMETLLGFCDLHIKNGDIWLGREPVEIKQKTLDLSFVQNEDFPRQEDNWLDLFASLKEQGYNMVRFEGFFPTEDAYLAADELGMLLLEEDCDRDTRYSRLQRYSLHPSCLSMISGDVAADGTMTFKNCGF